MRAFGRYAAEIEYPRVTFSLLRKVLPDSSIKCIFFFPVNSQVVAHFSLSSSLIQGLVFNRSGFFVNTSRIDPKILRVDSRMLKMADSNKFAIRTDGIRNLGYSAIATLQIPIFDWGANRSKLKQAELRRDQARLELSREQRQLLANLQGFYEEANVARSEMESLASSAEMAADSLRLTNLRYQAGESSVLEVVDAQNTLRAARNAYDDGQIRYRVAVANLQTLTGSF